jgi:hypothetical protein
MTLIDKIAWIQLADGRQGPQHAVTRQRRLLPPPGALTPSSEIAELAWLSYADRDRISPIDQIIFDHLHGGGQFN